MENQGKPWFRKGPLRWSRGSFSRRSASSIGSDGSAFSSELAAMVKINEQVIDENAVLENGEEALVVPSKVNRRRGTRRSNISNSTGYLADMGLDGIHLDQHLQSLSELESRYQTHFSMGLSHAEAGTRLARRGYNVINLPGKHSRVHRVGSFILSGMNVVMFVVLALLVIGYFLSYSQPVSDLYLILPLVIVMTIQTICGYLRARNPRRDTDHSEELMNLTRIMANVIREGEQVSIDARELVSGDICVLEAGSSVPADIRIISGSLRIDHGLLTGKSELPSIPKRSDLEHRGHANVFSASNLVFLSSTVVEGAGTGLVLNCGNKTIIGKLALQLQADNGYEFPLVRDLRYYYLSLTAIAILLGSIFLLIGIWITSAHTGVGDLSMTMSQQIGNAMGALASMVLAVLPLHFQLVLVLVLRKCDTVLKGRNVVVSHLSVIPSVSSISTFCVSGETGSNSFERFRRMGINMVGFFEAPGKSCSGIFDEDGLSDEEVDVNKASARSSFKYNAGSIYRGTQSVAGTEFTSHAELLSYYVKSNIGGSVGPVCYTGDSLDAFKSSELKNLFSKQRKYVEFFALKYMQKLRVVSQLKMIDSRTGTIAFFGGAASEEAPCLRAAHVGICLRQPSHVLDTTTRVSDVVVDSLDDVEWAVRVTRTAVNNFRRACMFFLTSAMPRMVPGLIYFSAGYPLALTPVLLVVGSLVIDLLPGIALTKEPMEFDVPKRRPRIERKERVISEKMILISCLVFGLLGCFAGMLGFTQNFFDFGFEPSGLVGLNYASIVVFDRGLSGEPGFPATSGIQFDMGIDRLYDMHLCGRVGNVAGLSVSALQAVPVTERCYGDLFTLDLFNQYCYAYLQPDSVYSSTIQDKVTFFEEQKYAQGVVFERNSTAGGIPVCGDPNADGIYLPYGFYSIDSQSQIDSAMKDQACLLDTTNENGNSVCFTSDALAYAQTTYFASISFFALMCALLVFRSEIHSIYQIGFLHKNNALIRSIVVSLGILAAIIYIPAMNDFLGTKPVSILAVVTPAFPFVVLAVVVDETRKFLMRRRTINGKWLMNRTMW